MILPPRNLMEFFLYDPIGSAISLMFALVLIAAAIRIALDYPTMLFQIDASKFCLGGACP
jgi:hypothetical protein